jgi:hypothetical protein
MFSELARVKPQGLAEYVCFVAILRCKDVFVIGGFDHRERWKYMRRFFLILLTLVDLTSSAGDWYYRIAQEQEVTSVATKDDSVGYCIAYTYDYQLKTYADIIFYAFSLVVCVFFTFIVAKFKMETPHPTIKRYRFNYTVIVAAFWAHCIQCLAGTLVFDQFNGKSTQTTELIYIAIYDFTMFILLFFLIKLKKLKLDPTHCNNGAPRVLIDNSYDNFHSKTLPPTGYAGVPSMTSLPTGYMDSSLRKFPTNRVSYIPVDQFDNRV